MKGTVFILNRIVYTGCKFYNFVVFVLGRYLCRRMNNTLGGTYADQTSN